MKYYIYIMTNRYKRVLYTGVTNNIIRRVYEHKHNVADGFTKRYNAHYLIYYEIFDNIEAAINREKQIKSWKRKRKITLIEGFNPQWHDLYEEIIQ